MVLVWVEVCVFVALSFLVFSLFLIQIISLARYHYLIHYKYVELIAVVFMPNENFRQLIQWISWMWFITKDTPLCCLNVRKIVKIVLWNLNSLIWFETRGRERERKKKNRNAWIKQTVQTNVLMTLKVEWVLSEHNRDLLFLFWSANLRNILQRAHLVAWDKEHSVVIIMWSIIPVECDFQGS